MFIALIRDVYFIKLIKMQFPFMNKQKYAKYVGLKRDFRLVVRGAARNMIPILNGSGIAYHYKLFKGRVTASPYSVLIFLVIRLHSILDICGRNVWQALLIL